MSMFESPRFLSRMTWADSATCAVIGSVQLLFTGWLAQSTGLPTALLAGSGIFLVAYALGIAGIASRTQPTRALIGLLAVGNVAWAVGCAALAFEGGLPLTLLGKLWLGAQAAVVLLLADLQWMGLRRSALAAGGYSGSDIARHKMLKSSSN